MVSTITSSREEACQNTNRTNEKDSLCLRCIRRTNPCSVLCIFGLGILLLIFGILVCTFWRQVFTQELIKKLPLSKNESQTTKLWLSQKVPQYLKVYMFNWTNPTESMEGDVPDFAECGPYIFRARVFKENVVWNDNHTVSYLQKRRWDFVPEMSNGTLQDRVTSINVVAVALGYQLKHVSAPFIVDLVNKGINLKRVPLVVTRSVESQLFEGYDDGILPVLQMVSQVIKPEVVETLSSVKNFISDMTDILTFNVIPPERPNTILSTQLLDRLMKLNNLKDKFGWWYQKNLTDTHHFNVHTGEDDVNLLGDIHSWDFKEKCKDNQEVHGSLGDLWPMKSAEGDRVLLFIPDMCSSFDLINAGPAEVDGVEGVKFIGTTETMGPSVARKPGKYVDTDLLTGIRNITSIVKAPIFISFPHFYQASEKYRLDLTGMNPDKEKHEFWLVLQKDAGVILEGHGRVQINIMVEPSSNIDLLSKLPSVLFPTIWFEQTAEIPPDIRQQLRFAFATMPRVLVGTGIASLIIAIICLVSGIVFVYLIYKPEPRRTASFYFNFLVFKSKSFTIAAEKPTTKPEKY